MLCLGVGLCCLFVVVGAREMFETSDDCFFWKNKKKIYMKGTLIVFIDGESFSLISQLS